MQLAFGQQTSIFGNTSTTGTTSLFGSQQTPSFGAPKQQIFGQPQQPTTSLFGQPQQPQQQTTSLFGQTAAPTPGTGLFGSTATSAFQPSANNQQNGTAIAKFQAQQETDSLIKGSTTSYIQTKQQCITFMKEYAEKSLEELRYEDYAANRKGPQAATAGGLFGTGTNQSYFGANQTSTPTGGFTGFGQQSTAQPIFGTNTNTLGSTSAFGTTSSAFNQNAGGLFGKSLQPPAATTSSAFGGFGGTNVATNNNTFGIAKPFNAAATTFGQPQPQQAGFGQPATNTFGASTFGQPQQQQQPQSLFGTSSQAPPAWNATSTATATGFNTNAGSNLFGASAAAKPTFGATNTFGSAPTNTFGASQVPTSSAFNFGQTAAGANNLFGQKPATNFFGQPAQQQTNANVSFGGSTLFGGANNPTGGNLFGSTPAQNAQSGGLFGSSQPQNNFGTSSLGLGLSFGSNQPSLFNK